MNDWHILLVEDNPDDEALTIRAFKKNDIHHKIAVVRDGAEAVDHLLAIDRGDAPAPVLILLDLKLPKVSGLDVLHQIRAGQRTRLIPVVVLTTSVEPEDVLAGYGGGANAYVRKPVSFSDFVAAVRIIGTFWLSLVEPPPIGSAQATPGGVAWAPPDGVAWAPPTAGPWQIHNLRVIGIPKSDIDE
jgi:two-component system response regulator